MRGFVTVPTPYQKKVRDLPPTAVRALGRLVRHKCHGDESSEEWLDRYREDVLTLWRELDCSGVAATVRVTPSELHAWRVKRDIDLPRPEDAVAGSW